MPKVSVIIPIYGVEKFIERCVRSLFEQTLDNIEFIFIDDCTPDYSMEILAQIIDEYRPRFAGMNWVARTERMPANSGQAAVRRHGIQLATGDYIIHCDSDDWVNTDMYRAMYEKAIEEDADVVVCDYAKSDGINELCMISGCRNTEYKVFIEDVFFQRVPWALWNKLFKKTVYSKGVIFPMQNMGEDMALTLQLIRFCGKISYVPQSFYYYYMNPASITKYLTTKTICRNFEAIKDNTDIVVQFYADCKLKIVRNGLLYLKYNTKAHLFPLVHRKEYRKLFKSIYKGLFWEMLFNYKISLKCKVKYLIVLLGLYPRKINY